MKPTILSRTWLQVQQVFFTSADLKDPDRLYRVLHVIQQNLSKALRVIALNASISGNRLTGVVFPAGQVQYIPHGLGRAYQGWYVVRAVGHASDLVETTLPAGTTSAQFLPLVSATGGTHDLWIF